jgi:hypothetical protein
MITGGRGGGGLVVGLSTLTGVVWQLRSLVG